MAVWMRTLLVWCLVLAVPAQGAAAVTRALCGGAHPATAVAAPAHAGPAAVHGHAHPAAGHEVHTAMAAAAADAAEAVPADSAGGGHGCSACAACCAPSVLPDATLALPVVVAGPVVFSVVEVAVEPFAADGPDRPPRSQDA
jgi:hypothetical protein